MTIAETAHAAAEAGGRVLMQYFRQGVSMRHKGSTDSVDLVSDADINAERTIVDVITSAFPDHSVLGEEEHSPDVSAEHLWIVDPLDGTTNFAHDIPHFAVSIAYYHHGRPEYGVIWNPARDDLYRVQRGEGAYHNDRRLAVTSTASFNDVLISVGFYYDRGAMMEATLDAIRECFGKQIRGIRRMGTASLDLAQVASGSFGAYFEYQLSPWDFAAGRLLVEEAGGQVTTAEGRPLPLHKTSVLASNGQLHAALQEITTRHLPAN